MGWWEGRASRPGEAATTEPSLSTHGHAYFHPGRCVGLAPRASDFAPCWMPRKRCVHVGVDVDVDVDMDGDVNVDGDVDGDVEIDSRCAFASSVIT